VSLPVKAALTPEKKRGAAQLKTREQLASEVFALFPAVKARLRAAMPPDMREELEKATWHQVEALHQLASPGKAGATMGEIAKLQGCALSSASALVDRLISQGLAERRPDPDDRRVIRIAPTLSGEDLMRRLESARRRLALNALAPLDDEEIELVVRLLTKVAHGSQLNAGGSDVEVAHG
jgi:DNA-binding MarR family transcriptional regulator